MKADKVTYGRVKTNNAKPKTIDEFIAQYPPDVQQKLETIRAIIVKYAPTATESISYGIAAFKLNGYFVFFSAFNDHIGMYPSLKGLEKELAPYKGGKGTIKFPMDKPLPLALIRKIVKGRIRENLERAEVKAEQAKAKKAKAEKSKPRKAKATAVKATRTGAKESKAKKKP
jgi:uncharacterized protein YdhG (YjbR/CyaY superfamily)